MSNETQSPLLPTLEHVFPDFRDGLLASLIDAAGPSQNISPRLTMGDSETPNADDLAHLYADTVLTKAAPPTRGLLSPAFLRAADVLRNPATNLTLRIWAASNDCAESNLQFPGSIAEGGGVILTSSETGTRVAAFANSQHVIGMATPFLRWAHHQPDDDPPPFEALLDFSSAIALCAAVDVSLVAGRDSAPKTFTVRDLHEHVLRRWGVSTFGELLTHGMAAIMAGHPPALQPFGLAVRTLAECDIFNSEDSETFVLAPAFLPVARRIVAPSAGLIWQRVSRLPDGNLERSCQSFLAVDQAVLRLAPGRPGHLYFELGGRTLARDFIASELASNIPAAEPKPQAAAIPPKLPTASTPTVSKAPPLPKTVPASPDGISMKMAIAAGAVALGIIALIWVVTQFPASYTMIDVPEFAETTPQKSPPDNTTPNPIPEPLDEASPPASATSSVATQSPPTKPNPPPAAPEADIAIEGPAKFQVNFSTRMFDFQCAEIANNRTGGKSGSLRLSIWASRSKTFEQGSRIYLMTEHPLQALPGKTAYKPFQRTLELMEIPPGEFYFAAAIEEFDGKEYLVRDQLFFPNPIQVP